MAGVGQDPTPSRELKPEPRGAGLGRRRDCVLITASPRLRRLSRRHRYPDNQLDDVSGMMDGPRGRAIGVPARLLVRPSPRGSGRSIPTGSRRINEEVDGRLQKYTLLIIKEPRN